MKIEFNRQPEEPKTVLHEDLVAGKFYKSLSTAPQVHYGYDRESDVIFFKNHWDGVLFFNKKTGDFRTAC